MLNIRWLPVLVILATAAWPLSASAVVPLGDCGAPPYADTDGDGMPDCNDGCPEDPGKVYPGICGCGVPDVDTDGDGWADCLDLCPTDGAKLFPGLCGCGLADLDLDLDGLPDCLDCCPDDPMKSAPGLCGCGIIDLDTDGDQTPDCLDGCPWNPQMTEPGICGCESPDFDADGDGTPDCADGCPDDPDKVAPGECGCGLPELPGCVEDLCPDDPFKTEPGFCGCGVPDMDSDGDGMPDCGDECPDNPDKITPGECGCDMLDIDTDDDGMADCHDLCPLDPAKFEPMQCGCGVPEIPGCGEPQPCVEDLGAAGAFNVFVFESYTGFRDVAGHIAAGGNVQGAQGFSVGHAHPGGDAVVAGGNVVLISGTVHGDAWAGGTLTLTWVDLRGTAHHGPLPVDFALVQGQMLTLSAGLATLPANGTVLDVGTPADPQWKLVGTDPVLNVFEVSGAALATLKSLTFQVPAGSTTIVNVLGPTMVVHDFSIFGADPQRLLWNAFQATTVAAWGIGMKGTLLAPFAAVSFNNGAWDGAVIARSMAGNGEMHWFPFLGELPCPEEPDPCDDPQPDDDCDGVDDDCDGLFDEEYLPREVQCGSGACTRTGLQFCHAGAIVIDCIPGEEMPDDDCNGYDDDCDGVVDDDFVPTPSFCGVGVCRNQGTLHCVQGTLVSDCTEFDPWGPDTNCDGLDDDCNGIVDDFCEPGGCSTDLGVAGAFNVFARDSYFGFLSVGGGIATGNLAVAQGFSVGAENPGGDVMVSGGGLDLSNGIVYGNAWSVDPASLVNVTVTGATNTGSLVDFNAAATSLLAFSTRLAGLGQTGVVQVIGTDITVTGTNPDVNVFYVSPDTLETATSFTVQVPAGSTVVVNVDGPIVRMHGIAFFGVDPGRLLFNLASAHDVFLDGIAGAGSLLAPMARVNFMNGSWAGTFAATRVFGPGEMHWAPFTGSVSCDPGIVFQANPAMCSATAGATPPAPAGLLLLGLGLVVALAFRRRAVRA